MSDISYANEKFYTAVDALCGGGPLRQRIFSAYMSFHTISHHPFDNKDLQTKFDEIMRRLTVVKDGDEDKGYVQNTLDKMSDRDAEEVSSLIVELAFNIQEANTRTPQ